MNSLLYFDTPTYIVDRVLNYLYYSATMLPCYLVTLLLRLHPRHLQDEFGVIVAIGSVFA